MLGNKECLDLTHAHNLRLAKLNAFNVLTNLPPIRSKPSLPAPPIEHIFIPEGKLKEIIREANEMRPQWEYMVTGVVKSPFLKKLKNTR